MVLTRLLVAYAMVLGAADAGTPAVKKPVDAGVVLKVDAGVASVDAGVKKAELAPDVKALVDRVQAFYEKTQDFTADFKQDYTYKVFKRTQTSSGKVTFKKPALMRWEYEKPSPKTFVLAGDRVFAHDPEAKLLTRAALNTNQLSASVTFLFGIGKLENEFSIVKKACPKCTGTQLEMTPLIVDPRFKRIYLEVDDKTAHGDQEHRHRSRRQRERHQLHQPHHQRRHQRGVLQADAAARHAGAGLPLRRADDHPRQGRAA